MSCASSTPLLHQLGNVYFIFQIQRHVTWHIYHFPTLPCSDWTDHTKAVIYPLNQNELEWIDPVLSARLLFIVAGELKFDQVKVVSTVRVDLLRHGNQQNLFSITAAAKKKMNSMHMERYWFCYFERTNKMVLQLFNSLICPRVMSWSQGGLIRWYKCKKKKKKYS